MGLSVEIMFLFKLLNYTVALQGMRRLCQFLIYKHYTEQSIPIAVCCQGQEKIKEI